MSTREPEGQLLFDVSDIDWAFDTAIDETAQLIWLIATTKGEDN